MRSIKKQRSTKETAIDIELNLDGTGACDIETGIGFLDHMLTLFSFHSKIDLNVSCKGDLEVDGHHTAEDIGLLLGDCISEALGDKKGIERYGSVYLPMDETLARVVLDISGRPYLVYECDYQRFDLGGLDVQNIKEFFKSLSNTLGLTLHMSVLYGENDHHKAEALFKGFGRALKEAVKVTSDVLPSTKGVL
ncbi:imidazoleglycerol-phosphate dehydratase HisB [Acidaminobacter sp. JC074]|uniref:imidazoleglycerol-phosphate dehydratase HisB n=1 Tax=Acidaminobacter sp. JC074 TaxID=2530199 RepID=UPI001F0D10E0|nr:imidazoleglycerol-phosphate dehydratase HisB [Acidaminobacter sp. JC074]MCH4888518.1 imidazoleglycerol-phosphate dehydratase HisB [Acidaminobacter sp. JC074]